MQPQPPNASSTAVARLTRLYRWLCTATGNNAVALVVLLVVVLAVLWISSIVPGCTGAATFSIDGRILGGLPAQPTTYPAMPADHVDGPKSAKPGDPPRLVWVAP